MVEEAGARPWDNLRVAIVHDWLTGMRGGEKVLESICRIFPGAPILTLIHVPGSVSAAIEAHPIRPAAPLRFLPGRARLYRHLLPLFPAVVETFDLDGVDLVISTSHCAAKSVVKSGQARHLCYCHSPMRYVWDQYEHYFGPERLGPARAAALRPMLAWLARWDRSTAHRVDRFLANSQHVAGRIARYYNRQAHVLHPPADTNYFSPAAGSPEPYFLVVSALVPYKRVDIAIEAAARMGAPLKIVGTGPDRARLEALAGPTVQFLGGVDNDTLRRAYRSAQALVLPAEEDFGIAPIEAMACGRPVVAFGRGGATETVRPGETGWLVDRQTPAAFADAMAEVAGAAFDPDRARAHAEGYGVERFEAAFRARVAETLDTARAC